MRIVSLLPAATEIVCALGLIDDLVGISHACDFPPAVAGRAVVTRPDRGPAAGPARRGAARVPGAPASAAPRGRARPAAPRDPEAPVAIDLEALAALRPDLVLVGPTSPAADAGRRLAGDSPLRDAVGPAASVVTLEPASLEGIFHAVATVGAMTSAEDEAVGLVEILRERLADVEEVVAERREAGIRAPRVVALDRLDPPRSAGLWVPEQVRRAGGWEVLGAAGDPSARTSWEAVAEVDPEMILLAPWGLHLAEAVAAWSRTPRPAGWGEVQAVRRGRVFALDAAGYVSRGGPRVIDGIELLAEIFDPAAFVDLAPAGSWVPVL